MPGHLGKALFKTLSGCLIIFTDAGGRTLTGPVTVNLSSRSWITQWVNFQLRQTWDCCLGLAHIRSFNKINLSEQWNHVNYTFVSSPSKDVVNCPRKAVKATMLIDTEASTSPSCLCNKLGILQYYVVWSTLCSSWVGDQSETKSFKTWISN